MSSRNLEGSECVSFFTNKQRNWQYAEKDSLTPKRDDIIDFRDNKALGRKRNIYTLKKLIFERGSYHEQIHYNNDGHKDDMNALIPVAADNEQINYDIDGDEIEQHHYDIDDNIENTLFQLFLWAIIFIDLDLNSHILFL